MSEPVVIWGLKSIGHKIGRTERAMICLVNRGTIFPGMRKVAGRWCMDVDAFRASFNQPVATP